MGVVGRITEGDSEVERIESVEGIDRLDGRVEDLRGVHHGHRVRTDGKRMPPLYP